MTGGGAASTRCPGDNIGASDKPDNCLASSGDLGERAGDLGGDRGGVFPRAARPGDNTGASARLARIDPSYNADGGDL